MGSPVFKDLFAFDVSGFDDARPLGILPCNLLAELGWAVAKYEDALRCKLRLDVWRFEHAP